MSGDEAEQEIETLVIHVPESEAGIRLDAYLATQIADWSRARIKRLIETGSVLVEGHEIRPSHKLRPNDRIEVELESQPHPFAFLPENIPVQLIYEDDELIVVDKPAGLVVHPCAGTPSGTLANALAFHFRQLSGDADGMRPGIIHRLDKGTSGLLVVAKTEDAHQKLADQFRAREVFKSYVALVYGLVEEETGRVEHPLARDPRHRTRMAVVRGGRGALSLYSVRRRYTGFTLLDVEIKTGRTHQIRVHLASIKHPVVADEVYGGGRDGNIRDPKLRARVAALGRQFLHAEKLGFRHPRSGEALTFTAPLAKELADFLDALA
jgi:23S rRNA pseudouridine1911/1915/1917 synthase